VQQGQSIVVEIERKHAGFLAQEGDWFGC
jgi:hypothetical protein